MRVTATEFAYSGHWEGSAFATFSALAHVTRRKVHMFERRARAYRTCLSNPENSTFVKLENAVKERKVHRNAADFDGKFIHETMQSECSAQAPE